MAQPLIKPSGAVVHREARTFDRKQAAAAWLERRERELTVPGALERQGINDPPPSNVIDRYVAESNKEIGQTKAQVLRTIKRYEIAELQCSTIGSTELVAFANQLATKVKPQTVSNYLSHLGSVFAIVRPAWGYPLDQAAMKDAFVLAKRLGVTSKSRTRDRRPTIDELESLDESF